MLQTRQLEYTYTNQKVIRYPDINFKKGEKWLIIGQSGCGKTTLLHLLAGIRAVQKGEIMVAGHPIHKIRRTALDKFRGKHIGIIFQKAHFVAALSVTENLLLAQQFANMKTDKNRILTLLQELNIEHKATSKPTALSQGEQQRVAIARALINAPDIILADEPTSALDDINCERVLHLLETQVEEAGSTLIIVTHDGRLKSFFPNQIQLTPIEEERIRRKE